VRGAETIETRSLALHAAVARRLVADPSLWETRSPAGAQLAGDRIKAPALPERVGWPARGADRADVDLHPRNHPDCFQVTSFIWF
jgi:hypothetical protein